MSRKAVGCPVEVTLSILDGRWKVLVLRELFGGVRRFNELRRALIGISHRTLTQQLRQLESSTIIHRKVFRQVPPKVEYSLTPLGRSLEPVLSAMRAWGVAFSQDVAHGDKPKRAGSRPKAAASPPHVAHEGRNRFPLR